MRRRTAGIGWLALAGAAALAWGGCAKEQKPAAPETVAVKAAGPPECPARFDSIVVDSGHSRLAFAQPRIAGPVSNVPEYHDCQRLLLGNSSNYGPLVGVWAAYQVASRFAGFATDTTPVAVAEVFSWDGSYGPLGIRQYFNCLYVGKSRDKLVATMVPLGLNSEGCGEKPSGVHFAHPLHVEMEGFHDSVPPVARWEWSRTGVQYIGLACGPNQWCRIGPPGIVKDSVHSPSELGDVALAGGSIAGKRLSVPGWYDEQRLAPPKGPPTVATDVRAIVVPHQGLGAYRYANFENQWAPAAFVRFETGSGRVQGKREVRAGYATKFGFAVGDTTSVISLCRGLERCPGLTKPVWDSLLLLLPAAYRQPARLSPKEIELGARPQVPNFWWAMVTVRGRDTSFRPVIRCDHSDVAQPIPGTARWRWTLDDEKVWVRCVNGCCEVR